MASYATRLRADIARWVEADLIDLPTAELLNRDVDATERKSLSFGTILAIMAALLFGAAILIFVAANWEAIPRLVRVGALFAVIFAGYVGGAFLKLNDHNAIGEALWLVAAAAFGGSIALIGQMYHLTGDEAEALLTWCAGTTVAALALRSGALTIAAVAMAAAWFLLRGVDFWRSTPFPHEFVVMAAVLWLVSYWTRSVGARHLLLLSLIVYAAMLAVDGNVVGVAAALIAISAVLFLLSVFLPVPTERVAQLDGRLPLHALIGFLAGIFLLQFQLADETTGAFALVAALALAGIAAAVVLAGRESRGLRWIAYAAFAVELCFIYGVMVGTMLGTAGFLLAAGAILGLLAFGIIRVEKRMSVAFEGAAA